MPTGDINIIFKRTEPNMVLDTLQALKDIPFISDETKREIAGIDEKKEKDRLESAAEEIDITTLIPQKKPEKTFEEKKLEKMTPEQKKQKELQFILTDQRYEDR